MIASSKALYKKSLIFTFFVLLALLSYIAIESPYSPISGRTVDVKLSKSKLSAPEFFAKPEFEATVIVSPPPDAARTPLVAVKLLPAIAATKSAIDSFLEPLLASASIIAIESFATSTAAVVNSLRSIAITPLAALKPAPANPVATSSFIIKSWTEFAWIVKAPPAAITASPLTLANTASCKLEKVIFFSVPLSENKK